MANIREDLRLVTIHGREFQKFSVDGRIYCVPVDDGEESRVGLQHDILLRMMGGRLYYPPMEDPQSILECGYGWGDWAVSVAEEFEDCIVTGVDVYPKTLPEQPENLELYGYNLNDRLNDRSVFQHKPYNLIHSRFVGPGIKSSRWSSYLRDMRLLLRPNGWVQIMEYYLNIQSDAGLLTEQSALTQWWSAYAAAMQRMNRDPRIYQTLGQRMIDAGLREVHMVQLKIPVGAWSTGQPLANIGRDSVAMVEELLESFALWPVTENGWTAAQLQALTNAARVELRNTALRLYVSVYVFTGRR